MKKIIFAFLAAFSSNLYAIDILKTFGSWEVVKTENGYAAIAINSNNDFMIFSCFSSTKQCMHTLSPSMKCEDKANYPILVNADSGATMITGICRETPQQTVLDLTPYDGLNNMLKKSSSIGFAIPLASGQFKVIRFNLNGSEAAINYTGKLITESKPDNEIL